jgi:hypothetical protein
MAPKFTEVMSDISLINNFGNRVGLLLNVVCRIIKDLFQASLNLGVTTRKLLDIHKIKI